MSLCGVGRGRRAGNRLIGVVAAAASVLSLACSPAEPGATRPANAVALVPPAHFADWWARTEACSGRRGKLDEVAWFVVPGSATFLTPRGPMVANWSRTLAGSEIVVASGYLSDEMVVRHEMLHALLDVADHPKEFFEDRCRLTWSTRGGWSPDDTSEARRSASRE